MGFKQRINYWRRVIVAYRKGANSQLTFWHEKPAINEDIDFKDPASGYYMTFYDKTLYPGPFDEHGVPLLDYKGVIGKQYNPIAIAQYGLGFYNRYVKEKKEEYLKKFLVQCSWLVDNLEENEFGLLVWMHHFDWEYQGILKSPWQSSLAQGSGISALLRGFLVTNEKKYLDAAILAFKSFKKDVSEGGVTYTDDNGYLWFEEYIIEPYSHVLNGFIWSLFGVYDFYLVTKDDEAKKIFGLAIKTLTDNLHRFDTGFWSLYSLSPTKLKLIASPFYHSLHIVQLDILYRITKEKRFLEFKERWQNYKKSWVKRNYALIYKIIFKIFYY